MFRVHNSVAMAVLAATFSSNAVAQESQPIARAVFLQNMDVEFRKMDADKNGTVTRLEMEQFRRAVSITEGQSRNRALFARLDVDRNGQISPAEFTKMTVPAPAPNAAPQMAKFDINKDQGISLIEYRTGTLDNFDKLDTDKDGYVTAAEMRAGGIAR